MSKSYIFLGDLIPDHTLAMNKREAWMPKGDVPYFDKSAQRTFYSRREKRQWLAAHGLREAGIVNPTKAP